jgi:hypothetical protein
LWPACRLIVWCKACQHPVQPDPAEHAGRYAAEMTFGCWRPHTLGFSLPSAMPLGEAFVEAIASMLADLGGLLWSWRHTAGALIGALSGEDAGASSALPISSIERPFVSKPRNKKTSPAWPYQKARKSSAGKIASSVTFGLT